MKWAKTLCALAIWPKAMQAKATAPSNAMSVECERELVLFPTCGGHFYTHGTVYCDYMCSIEHLILLHVVRMDGMTFAVLSEAPHDHLEVGHWMIERLSSNNDREQVVIARITVTSSACFAPLLLL